MGKSFPSRNCFFIEFEGFESRFSTWDFQSEFFSDKVGGLRTECCSGFWVNTRFWYRKSVDTSCFCMDNSRREFYNITVFECQDSSCFSPIPGVFDTVSSIKSTVCPIDIHGSLFRRNNIKGGNLGESHRKPCLVPECAGKSGTHFYSINHAEDIFRTKTFIFLILEVSWFWKFFLESKFGISHPKEVAFPERKITFLHKKLNQFWIISADIF